MYPSNEEPTQTTYYDPETNTYHHFNQRAFKTPKAVIVSDLNNNLKLDAIIEDSEYSSLGKRIYHVYHCTHDQNGERLQLELSHDDIENRSMHSTRSPNLSSPGYQDLHHDSVRPVPLSKRLDSRYQSSLPRRMNVERGLEYNDDDDPHHRSSGSIIDQLPHDTYFRFSPSMVTPLKTPLRGRQESPFLTKQYQHQFNPIGENPQSQEDRFIHRYPSQGNREYSDSHLHSDHDAEHNRERKPRNTHHLPQQYYHADKDYNSGSSVAPTQAKPRLQLNPHPMGNAVNTSRIHTPHLQNGQPSDVRPLSHISHNGDDLHTWQQSHHSSSQPYVQRNFQRIPPSVQTANYGAHPCNAHRPYDDVYDDRSTPYAIRPPQHQSSLPVQPQQSDQHRCIHQQRRGACCNGDQDSHHRPADITSTNPLYPRQQQTSSCSCHCEPKGDVYYQSCSHTLPAHGIHGSSLARQHQFQSEQPSCPCLQIPRVVRNHIHPDHPYQQQQHHQHQHPVCQCSHSLESRPQQQQQYSSDCGCNESRHHHMCSSTISSPPITHPAPDSIHHQDRFSHPNLSRTRAHVHPSVLPRCSHLSTMDYETSDQYHNHDTTRHTSSSQWPNGTEHTTHQPPASHYQQLGITYTAVDLRHPPKSIPASKAPHNMPSTLTIENSDYDPDQHQRGVPDKPHRREQHRYTEVYHQDHAVKLAPPRDKYDDNSNQSVLKSSSKSVRFSPIELQRQSYRDEYVSSPHAHPAPPQRAPQPLQINGRQDKPSPFYEYYHNQLQQSAIPLQVRSTDHGHLPGSYLGPNDDARNTHPHQHHQRADVRVHDRTNHKPSHKSSHHETTHMKQPRWLQDMPDTIPIQDEFLMHPHPSRRNPLDDSNAPSIRSASRNDDLWDDINDTRGRPPAVDYEDQYLPQYNDGYRDEKQLGLIPGVDQRTTKKHDEKANSASHEQAKTMRMSRNSQVLASEEHASNDDAHQHEEDHKYVKTLAPNLPNTLSDVKHYPKHNNSGLGSVSERNTRDEPSPVPDEDLAPALPRQHKRSKNDYFTEYFNGTPSNSSVYSNTVETGEDNHRRGGHTHETGQRPSNDEKNNISPQYSLESVHSNLSNNSLVSNTRESLLRQIYASPIENNQKIQKHVANQHGIHTQTETKMDPRSKSPPPSDQTTPSEESLHDDEVQYPLDYSERINVARHLQIPNRGLRQHLIPERRPRSGIPTTAALLHDETRQSYQNNDDDDDDMLLSPHVNAYVRPSFTPTPDSFFQPFHESYDPPLTSDHRSQANHNAQSFPHHGQSEMERDKRSSHTITIPEEQQYDEYNEAYDEYDHQYQGIFTPGYHPTFFKFSPEAHHETHQPQHGVHRRARAHTHLHDRQPQHTIDSESSTDEELLTLQQHFDQL